MSTNRCATAVKEVNHLLDVGFILEACFQSWVANVCLVKNSNGKWRMCVDNTYLNKACPKDVFPLPCIKQLLDSTIDFELLSFMDA